MQLVESISKYLIGNQIHVSVLILGLCFLLFAMFQTCAYLYSSNYTQQVKEARNQSQLFISKFVGHHALPFHNAMFNN